MSKDNTLTISIECKTLELGDMPPIPNVPYFPIDTGLFVEDKYKAVSNTLSLAIAFVDGAMLLCEDRHNGLLALSYTHLDFVECDAIYDHVNAIAFHVK